MATIFNFIFLIGLLIGSLAFDMSIIGICLLWFSINNSEYILAVAAGIFFVAHYIKKYWEME